MAANLSPIKNSDVGNDIGNVIVSDIVNVVVSDIVNDVGFWDQPVHRVLMDEVQWPPQVELGQGHLTPSSTVRRESIMGAPIYWYSTWGATGPSAVSSWTKSNGRPRQILVRAPDAEFYAPLRINHGIVHPLLLDVGGHQTVCRVIV